MSSDSPPPIDALRAVDAACDRFEAAWAAVSSPADGPRCESHAAELPESARADGLAELFAIERACRAERGDASLGWAAGRAAIAHLAGASADDLETLAVASSGPPAASGGLRVRCPHCDAGLALLADAPLEEISCRTCGSTFGLVDKPGHPAPPPVRVGRFLLRERLGVGGFGAVWRARDPELDRDVALKLPRRAGLAPHEAEMFFREARAAAQLAHPGIVSVYEVGRDDAPDGTGAIYLVNELVAGEPLSQWMREGRPGARLAAAIVADIADALHAAHEQGVIHRDLKPSNVMLDRSGVGGETTRVAPPGFGRPRLMDFGLAKRDAGEATITTDGQVLGTPAYMSPEQASGRVAWVDRRTDVYSLGVVLFRLLTGELPFRGSATSQIQQRQTDDPPPPRRLDPSAPRDLETVCLRGSVRVPNSG
ncbi:MAG: serine/threonine-protein kinase, partial [Planctomycetota bacterium]